MSRAAKTEDGTRFLAAQRSTFLLSQLKHLALFSRLLRLFMTIIVKQKVGL